MSWADYTRAIARIQLPTGWMQVRPAEPGLATGTFPDPTGHPIHILTAHNPRGQIATAAANQRAHRRLDELVRAEGYEVIPAAGGDAAWTHVEESIAVLGIPQPRARELGRVFGQDAIFAWTPKEWVVLSCAEDTQTSQGWVAEPLDAQVVALADAVQLLGLPQGANTLPAANAALERHLQATSDPQQHRRLHDAFLLIADDFWSGKERERVRRLAQQEAEPDAAQAERRAQREAQEARRAQERDEAVRWGWPPSWPLGGLAAWQRQGRTAREARAWADAGWRPQELKGLRCAEGALPHPPAGAGQTWRDIGADAGQALELQRLGLDVDHLAAPLCDAGLADWILQRPDRLAWAQAGVAPTLAEHAEASGLAPNESTSALPLIQAFLQPGTRERLAPLATWEAPFGEAVPVPHRYLRSLGRTPGLLVTIHSNAGSLEVHGHGTDVSVQLEGGELRLAPDSLRALPQSLHLLGCLPDDTEFVSGAWDAGDVATLFSGYVEALLIDGTEWGWWDGIPVPPWPFPPDEVTVASNHWELIGGAGGPGHDDDGIDYLLKIGPTYVVIGNETMDVLGATTRAEAIKEFRRNFIADGRDDLVHSLIIEPKPKPKPKPKQYGV